MNENLQLQFALLINMLVIGLANYVYAKVEFFPSRIEKTPRKRRTSFHGPYGCAWPAQKLWFFSRLVHK